MNDFFYPIYADIPRETRTTSPVVRYANERLVQIVQDCEATCEYLSVNIKSLPDFQSRKRQAALLRECADICNLTAKTLARNMRNTIETKHITIISLCTIICEDCAAECAKFSDPMSQQCANICMNCASECKDYISR